MPTSRPAAPAREVIALGSFDGVHLGHRAILDRARALARECGGAPSAMTFDPLPAQLVQPDFTYVLTPLPEKTALLLELGLERIHVVRFDEALQHLSPERFVEQFLLPLAPCAVVAGADHRFGHRGRGDVRLLESLLSPLDVRVEVVPEVMLHEAPVRSTRIRERLLLGDVARARELLGRPYSLSGAVVSGTGTGRRLGFPTINLNVSAREKLIPADGVYAVRVACAGRDLPAAVNIGHRPTFDGSTRTIEAHLIDEHLESAPEHATFRFIARLRPERRFATPEELAGQIAADVAAARTLLDRNI